MNGNISQTTTSAALQRRCWTALVLLAVGCSTVPPVAPPAPPPVVVEVPSDATIAAATRGEFTIPASMLDTWNAVGQILVRVDGVTYEGRSQMLGIYVVRYRGERFLIVTRALVMRSRADGMVTKVNAVLSDGKSNGSEAAVALLRLLQRRLPAEIARIAAGGGRV